MRTMALCASLANLRFSPRGKHTCLSGPWVSVGEHFLSDRRGGGCRCSGERSPIQMMRRLSLAAGSHSIFDDCDADAAIFSLVLDGRPRHLPSNVPNEENSRLKTIPVHLLQECKDTGTLHYHCLRLPHADDGLPHARQTPDSFDKQNLLRMRHN